MLGTTPDGPDQEQKELITAGLNEEVRDFKSSVRG
jgi:hypothetical protein